MTILAIHSTSNTFLTDTMKLNRSSDYGLQGLMFLAKQPPGTVLLLSEIALGAGVPQSFLAKIFLRLTQQGVLKSYRGRKRGYALAKAVTEINLKDVFEATEGPDLFDRCIFWSDRCVEENPCPLHEQWTEVSHEMLKGIMERTTLDELLQKALAGDSSDCPVVSP